MDSNILESEADVLLRAGKKVADDLSDIPALYSIAISLKRIADAMTTGDKHDRIAATEVAKALGYKPGSAAHDLLICTIEVMAAKGFMVVES
jgi:hypothetical protein